MRPFRRLLRAGAGVIATLALSGVSLAAQANDGFVIAKPEDIDKENLPATPLVFGAYAIVWIVVTVYVLTLWRRIAKTEQEVAAVAARLEQQRR
jgi:CcmD family protein